MRARTDAKILSTDMSRNVHIKILCFQMLRYYSMSDFILWRKIELNLCNYKAKAIIKKASAHTSNQTNQLKFQAIRIDGQCALHITIYYTYLYIYKYTYTLYWHTFDSNVIRAQYMDEVCAVILFVWFISIWISRPVSVVVSPYVFDAAL